MPPPVLSTPAAKRAANNRVLPHHLAGRRINGQHKIPIRSTRCIAGREGYATYVLPPLLKDRGRAAISLAVVACHHVQPGTVGIKEGSASWILPPLSTPVIPRCLEATLVKIDRRSASGPLHRLRNFPHSVCFADGLNGHPVMA